MAIKFEDYNQLYDDVYALFRKRKTILDVYKKFVGDPSDQHVAVSMYIMMCSHVIDDVNILAEVKGDGRKTVKAFELEEDSRGNGTYKRFVEDIVMDQGAFHGSHVNAILQESTPYEGDWRIGGKRVVAGLTIRSDEIDLKLLIKTM